MIRIALTGGIGSGKSHVAQMLAARGIDVYDCDAAAKRLISGSPELQQQLSEAVGRELFADGKFDKAQLSEFIVASEENAQKIDSIVHPAVAADYMASECQWLESAILFESGFDKRVAFDIKVCVVAPDEIRLERIMQRDGISRQKALEWIQRQMPDKEKALHADFVIVNDGMADVGFQVDCLLNALASVNEQAE